jgi:hypothetical protein
MLVQQRQAAQFHMGSGGQRYRAMGRALVIRSLRRLADVVFRGIRGIELPAVARSRLRDSHQRVASFPSVPAN